MEQRRFLLFLALSMAVFVGWVNIGPVLFPGLFPQPRPRPVAEEDNVAPVDGDAVARDDDLPAVAPKPEQAPVVADPEPADDDVAQRQPIEDAPRRTVKLGSLDPETGYFLQVTLTSEGAAIETIEFSDPRYRDLEHPDQPLKMVGNNVGELDTLETSVGKLDAQLAAFGQNLTELDWALVDDPRIADGPRSQATFRTVVMTAQSQFELRKTYTLDRVDKSGDALREARDNDASGYLIGFEFAIKNLGNELQKIEYTLQGPVGVPLENAENTRIFRAVKRGYLEPPEMSAESESKTAASIDEDVKDKRLDEWRQPLKYIGVDMQYFAALLAPAENQVESPYIAVSRPVLVESTGDANHSDVSVQLVSEPIELNAGEEVTHSYLLFAGPKREALLSDARLDASPVLEYGWFGAIAKGMLWLLKVLHDVGIPYGLAIICMTVLVRGCMFPISRKQAAGAKKMKELQPKIQELRKKYANDKERMAREQMELFRKHGYNPFAGCLPLFLQLPIFIGLYTALSHAVDLRMAPFLWIDNLAAPDALFQMPFALPFLGQKFNLLPIVTVILFVVQQKMFMPPAADKEQEMQFKMMNYMMIFFGFMFYKVPAGLCVYFIASSLWGIGERKLLDLGVKGGDKGKDAGPQQTSTASQPATAAAGDASGNGTDRRAARRERRRARQQR